MNKTHTHSLSFVFAEYEFVSPLANMEGIPMKNLAADIKEKERYSFIFQGNSIAIDHILVSENLCSSSEAEYVHVNSEFPFSPMRASDHDPVIAAIEF